MIQFKTLRVLFLNVLVLMLLSLSLNAQEDKAVLNNKTFDGLEFRSIGPAFMSGRIADIAIDPNDENLWYVAVGSGNVFKTKNSGITWTPIFDNESVYSTGCITIDPNNSNTLWLGTGENVGGRHLSWGDGVYKSTDAGQTWTNMGLNKSEHIAEIIVHPENSDVIWVASQGPIWNKGGERGVFKSTDGGATWKQTLGDKAWTGATEIVIDPRNPNRLYAATWQRHRTVAAYMGGGPGSGLYRSEDGAENWTKLESGLPKSNIGKIGLTISPQKPDELYAALELDHRKGGVYKSIDRGASWVKQSDAVSGATGPHYYQELYACPHNYDRLYLMDVRAQISDDGGKTFRRMKEEHKHSDNHSINFKADDPDYLLIGTDGGIYESFDLAENWRFIANLPLTQFYKIAVDDAEPFYNVYGGTQDNSTEGGPSRTDKVQGIENSDWSVVLNWDGHQPATEPGNPDIMYGQRQQGTLSRIDLKTGEVMDIQPQAREGEDYERYNWDAPILVSPHDPKQIYFASQRLWRSNDRGDNWNLISDDLTRNENRLELPIMGRVQSWDNAWDLSAMSNYNTITSIAESPIQRNLIYIGTDDGLIQVTEDGGTSWRKMSANQIKGLPKRIYVNDIKADLYDANVAYMLLDNHKTGDFKPYVYKTTDKGKTWKSITNNIPDGTIVWRIVQDHVNPDLLFLGTEFGIYVSLNGGNEWTQMKGGLPTISFRDLAIQRRENDLVCGSFGRSIYILDDYTSLRTIDKNTLASNSNLYPVRDAWWYIPRSHLGFSGKRGDQGAGYFVADNPEFGAMFTYYNHEALKSKKELRTEIEKALNKNNQNVPFPGWDALDAEMQETKPSVWFTIKNADGEVIRRVKGKSEKGFHRTNWDLRYPAPHTIADQSGGGFFSPRGFMAPPGMYSVQMSHQVGSEVTSIGEAQNFEVKQLREGTLEGASIAEVSDFWRSYESLTREVSLLNIEVSDLNKKLKRVKKAVVNSRNEHGSIDSDLSSASQLYTEIDTKLNGSQSKRLPGQSTRPTIGGRMFSLLIGLDGSTYGPTTLHKDLMKYIKSDLKEIKSKVTDLDERLSGIAAQISNAGGPYIKE